MNKWIVRDYEYEDGPLEGEVRNPKSGIQRSGADPNDISLTLTLRMKRANMDIDGTNNDNNDCYFNYIDDQE